MSKSQTFQDILKSFNFVITLVNQIEKHYGSDAKSCQAS